MATVIAVVNSKGGVGKSTNAVHLADAIHKDGKRVLLLDNDRKQASAHRWSQTAQAAGRDTFQVTIADGGLQGLVRDLRPAYDFIIIDAPGHLDEASSALVAVADVVLIPIQPSALDLWACENAINWIEQRQMITGGLPVARFLLTRCNPDERVNRDDATEIAATGIPVLSARTVHRVSYARAMRKGGTVLDQGEDDKARCEILDIYKELLNVCDQ